MTSELDRVGPTLTTRCRELIQRWAQDRSALPATVAGSEHDGHAGSLRFDFGQEDDRLRHIGWDEWFEAFDARGMSFIYQDTTPDGALSKFCRIESTTPEAPEDGGVGTPTIVIP
jgi:hypothetical protein